MTYRPPAEMSDRQFWQVLAALIVGPLAAFAVLALITWCGPYLMKLIG